MTALEPLSREDGFTLVELLVAISLSLIVLLATLSSLDVFSSNAAHQTRATDASDQVRTMMDRTVTDLRGASTLLRASSTDLAYAVPQTASTIRTERLCVSSSELYASTVTAATATTPPVACSGTKVATLQSGSATTFTYDSVASSTAAALVKNVGLTFSLESTGGGKTATSTLTASAARRSASALLLTDPDVKAGCQAGGGALLSLAASVPGLAGLSVTFTSSSGVVLGTITGSGTLPIASSVTSVTATVTDALGATNLLQKDIQCDA